MRSVLVPAALTCLLVACGATKLSRSEAEKDIRKDYPVVVTVHVPEKATSIKGSPDHASLVLMQEALSGKGFNITRVPEGDRETFTFTLNPAAPKSIKTAPKGFELPAAQAEFVKASALEPTRDGARVRYEIRLVRPAEFFPLFQKLHPKAQIGALQTRNASYVKDGRSWILKDTDERYRKAE